MLEVLAAGSGGQGALEGSAAWQRSRFGELERFMVEFLGGGGPGGGGGGGSESLRLKLQTPLFVADALLDAAARQLAGELATAQQVRPHARPRPVPADGAAGAAAC